MKTTVWYDVYIIAGGKEFIIEEMEFITKAEAEEHFKNTFGAPTEVVRFRKECTSGKGNKYIVTKAFFTKVGFNWIVEVKRLVSDT